MNYSLINGTFRNKLMAGRLSLTLLCFCSEVSSQSSGIYDSAYRQAISMAEKFIDSLMTKQGIPSVSIAVGVKGKTVWAKAFGFSDAGQGVQATPLTQYRVGSISKSMTGFALGKLYDQGLINLDSSIGFYIPEYRQKKYPITIRQIAGHQGGIRHYRGTEFISNTQFNSVEESLSIFQDDSLLFKPGTQYLYSSYGYVLLSRLIEIQTGKSYLSYMKEQILTPLGMRTTIAENAGMDESNKAKFYFKGGVKEAPVVNLSSKWAAGGFLSTPTDLVNMVNNATRLMSASTFYMLTTPQKLKNEKETDYGVGWRQNVVNDGKRILIHHGGTSAGARAFLMLMLNEQIVVAICTNSDCNYGLQEVYDIGKYFLGNVIR